MYISNHALIFFRQYCKLFKLLLLLLFCVCTSHQVNCILCARISPSKLPKTIALWLIWPLNLTVGGTYEFKGQSSSTYNFSTHMIIVWLVSLANYCNHGQISYLSTSEATNLGKIKYLASEPLKIRKQHSSIVKRKHITLCPILECVSLHIICILYFLNTLSCPHILIG